MAKFLLDKTEHALQNRKLRGCTWIEYEEEANDDASKPGQPERLIYGEQNHVHLKN